MKLLRIYLDDHWAGAAAGTALAERLAAENADSPWGSDLAWIADQIRDDHRALAGVRRDLGFHGGVLKKAVAIVGERVGRLKPNGRLVRYSPLSRVLEIELLMSGVLAKQGLWRSLQTSDEVDRLLEGHDLAGLERRATEQLDSLRAIHRAASAVAFADVEFPEDER